MSNQKERAAWKLFADKAQGRLNFERIENSLAEATPDAIGINKNGAVFWIETKALDDWPVRATTLPLRTAFEKGQVPFLRQWRSWRGTSFVLLRAGSGAKSDWLLLDPREPLTEQTKIELVLNRHAMGIESILVYLENLQ